MLLSKPRWLLSYRTTPVSLRRVIVFAVDSQLRAGLVKNSARKASDWANGWINEFVREMQAKDRAPRTKRAVDLTPAAAVPPAEEPLPPAAAAETSRHSVEQT